MVNQAGKYSKLRNDEIEQQPVSSSSGSRDVESQEKTVGEVAQEFTRKTMVVIALTVLTSSQGLLIAVSKQGGKFEYSVMSANCMVEVTKCVISLLFLMRQWNTLGVTDDNTLMTTHDALDHTNTHLLKTTHTQGYTPPLWAAMGSRR